MYSTLPYTEMNILCTDMVFRFISTGVGSGGGGKGGMWPPLFWLGGNGMFVPPTFNPTFLFPLELYVYITLTNNYLAFFIYQLIILWTISINWHIWLLLNNHVSKYNSFILVLYRRNINYVSVCPPPPPPPPPPTHTQTLFGTFLRHWLGMEMHIKLPMLLFYVMWEISVNILYLCSDKFK